MDGWMKLATHSPFNSLSGFGALCVQRRTCMNAQWLPTVGFKFLGACSIPRSKYHFMWQINPHPLRRCKANVQLSLSCFQHRVSPAQNDGDGLFICLTEQPQLVQLLIYHPCNPCPVVSLRVLSRDLCCFQCIYSLWWLLSVFLNIFMWKTFSYICLYTWNCLVLWTP